MQTTTILTSMSASWSSNNIGCMQARNHQNYQGNWDTCHQHSAHGTLHREGSPQVQHACQGQGVMCGNTTNHSSQSTISTGRVEHHYSDAHVCQGSVPHHRLIPRHNDSWQALHAPPHNSQDAPQRRRPLHHPRYARQKQHHNNTCRSQRVRRGC